MRTRVLILAATLSIAGAALAAPVAEIHKREGCGCCGLWADHLAKHGLKTRSSVTDDLDTVRATGGIPDRLGSCHTAFVGGYAVEGHVPASAIKRLLKEKPDAAGLAVAGMPGGSPGMESMAKVPYEVLLVLKDGSTRVYSRH
jgi:hypothetical protein